MSKLHLCGSAQHQQLRKTQVQFFKINISVDLYAVAHYFYMNVY